MKLFDDKTLSNAQHFNVGQDWETPIVGFFIVAANDALKKSIEDFSDLEAQELILLLKRIRMAMREVLGIQEVRLLQNEGSEHGFHIWIFPRHDWMEPFGKKLDSIRPIIQYAKENFVTQEKINEINDAAQKVKEYMNK